MIPYHKDGYRTDEAANLLSNLMNDAAKREVMALTAIEKARNIR